jgi:hypothetical protein
VVLEITTIIMSGVAMAVQEREKENVIIQERQLMISSDTLMIHHIHLIIIHLVSTDMLSLLIQLHQLLLQDNLHLNYHLVQIYIMEEMMKMIILLVCYLVLL